MLLHPTCSEILKSVDYNSETKILKVVCRKCGTAYEFPNVPKQIYYGLIESSNFDNFFSVYVYPLEKICR
jgi:hypothetical protein